MDLEKFECEHCGKKFCTKYEVEKHLRVRTGEKSYKCMPCEKSFAESSLRHQEKIYSNLNVFECDYCKKNFTAKRSLINHLRSHAEKKSQKLSYKNPKSEKTRLRSNSLCINENNYKVESHFECDYCKKRFKSIGDLENHIWIHMDEILYECDYCKNMFKNKDDIIHHIRIHTSEKPYECKFCKKTFSQKGVLRFHEIDHAHSKADFNKFECEQCGRVFLRKSEIIIHMRTHADKRAYQCNSPKSEVFNKTLVKMPMIKIERIRIEDYLLSNNNSKDQQCKKNLKQNHSSATNNLNSSKKDQVDETELEKSFLRPFYANDERKSSHSEVFNKSLEIRIERIRIEDSLLPNHNSKDQQCKEISTQENSSRANNLNLSNKDQVDKSDGKRTSSHSQVLNKSLEVNIERIRIENYLSSNSNSKNHESTPPNYLSMTNNVNYSRKDDKNFLDSKLIGKSLEIKIERLKIEDYLSSNNNITARDAKNVVNT